MNVEEQIISISRRNAGNYMPSFHCNLEVDLDKILKKLDTLCLGSAMTF